MKNLPVPTFAWPIIIAFLVALPLLKWATFPLLGMQSRVFWGVYFALTLLACVVIAVRGLLKELRK